MGKSPLEYFTDGYLAAEQGLPVTANPFLFDASPKQAWDDGWSFFNSHVQIWLEGDKEPLKRVDKPPHEQGKVAALKGIALNDCPYGEGTDRIAWQNGWLCGIEAEADIKQLNCLKTALITIAIVVVIGIAIYFTFQ